jgi:hypothetical protein
LGNVKADTILLSFANKTFLEEGLRQTLDNVVNTLVEGGRVICIGLSSPEQGARTSGIDEGLLGELKQRGLTVGRKFDFETVPVAGAFDPVAFKRGNS